MPSYYMHLQNLEIYFDPVEVLRWNTMTATIKGHKCVYLAFLEPSLPLILYTALGRHKDTPGNENCREEVSYARRQDRLVWEPCLCQGSLDKPHIQRPPHSRLLSCASCSICICWDSGGGAGGLLPTIPPTAL